MMPADIHGILLLDKPLGMSSAGAVARAKYLFEARKAGHTGVLGSARFGAAADLLRRGDQIRRADARRRQDLSGRRALGRAHGERGSGVAGHRATRAAAVVGARHRSGARGFPRDYAQVPPMHSALKQDGKPLYEYARAGITRERAARQIAIHEMTLLEWRAPDIHFDVRCSKGAYIRVLAEDLALRLGTIAHLVALRRIGVAPFGAEPLWTFEALEALLTAAERRLLLLPVDAALERLAPLRPAGRRRRSAAPGQSVEVPGCLPGNVRIYAAGQGFLGLGEVRRPVAWCLCG
jgi:tRNA pseudouridine55 synthase